MSTYNIGTGKADITLRDVSGIGLLGFSIPCQKTDGQVLYTLYSRAFAIHDPNSNKHIMIVIADLWSCTKKLKKEVLSLLHESGNYPYSFENVMISGTHTHSSPGGYSEYRMYNINTNPSSKKGKENIQENITKIVQGIVTSIEQAYQNLKPGKILIHTGKNNKIEGCGLNRSLTAYEKNPIEERTYHGSSVDNYMTLIKFVLESKQPIGVLSWFPIHGADIGQKNKFISGDNKGYAAHLFEYKMIHTGNQQQPFVAAFANSNCGDVSGNVVYEGKEKILSPPQGGTPDIDNMEHHGKLQFDKALELFTDKNEEHWVELDGAIDFQYLDEDMSNQKDIHGDPKKKTYIPTTGLVAYAGSKEDGTTPFKPFNNLDEDKGIRADTINKKEKAVLLTIQALTSGEGAIDPTLALIAALAAYGTLNSTPVSEFPKEQTAGHFPKPIAVVAEGLVPSLLPMQLLKIGNLVIPAIPGELTTMAGRRLKKSILDVFEGSEVCYLALGTYSNAYAQYITTKEEYDHQSYEGASTLFGPHTLEAYQQIFENLATKMKNTSLQKSASFQLLASHPILPIDRSALKPQILASIHQTPLSKSNKLAPLAPFLLHYVGELKHLGVDMDNVCDVWLSPSEDVLFHFHAPYPQNTVGVTEDSNALDCGFAFIKTNAPNTTWWDNALPSIQDNLLFSQTVFYFCNTPQKPTQDYFTAIPSNLEPLRQTLFSYPIQAFLVDYNKSFLVSLALDFGALHLNKSFLFSHHTNTLRNFLSEKQTATKDKNAIIEPSIFSNHSSFQQLQKNLKWQGGHLLALVPLDEKLVFYASLYGKDAQTVLLSYNPTDWEDKFETGVVLIVSDTQEVVELSLEDFLADQHEQIAYRHPALTAIKNSS